MAASLLRQWLDAPGGAFVWIDFAAYARRVFARDAEDWLVDPVRHASTLIEAQGVVPTRCLTVDVAAPFLAALPPAPDAATAVAALGEAGPLAFIDQVLDALLHRFEGRLDIMLRLPSPGDVLGGGEADFDALDDVATALTALVRRFADRHVAGLVLEQATGGALSADEADACEPLFGAARHYDWLTVLAFPAVGDGAASAAGADADVVLLPATPFAALPDAIDGVAVGGGLDPGFWAGTASAPAGAHLYYGAIPADAEPETVLSVLRTLAG